MNSVAQYQSDVNILDKVNAGDPPVWIENKIPANNAAITTCPPSKEILNHHKRHSIKLKDVFKNQGLEWHLKLQSSTTHKAGSQQYSNGVAFMIGKL